VKSDFLQEWSAFYFNGVTFMLSIAYQYRYTVAAKGYGVQVRPSSTWRS